MGRLIERGGTREAAGRRRVRRVGEEDFMAMMKAGLAGAAVGALALATVLFVAPIAAQGPPSGPDGFRAPGGPPPSGPPPDGPGMRGPGMMGPGMGGRGMGPMGREGPGMMGRRGADANDPDITGPRGDLEECQERLARLAQRRTERIARLTRPTEEQRAAFEELKTAFAKAAETMRAACPTERPLTPTARMAMAEKWLEARLQAIRTVRPVLESFYRLLSDEQKIRWIAGPMLGDRFGERWQGRGDREDLWRDERRRDDRWGNERWRGEERGGWGRPERDQEGWRERWRDWRERFGEDRGPERWGERWRNEDGDRWRQDRWRGWRNERGRSEGPNEERL
jgi:LTXXQ motif family protein